jgi:hypothetical protein
VPERFSRSLGRPLREREALPWDISSILSVNSVRPAADAWAGGCACAEGVPRCIRPGVGTNVTAKTRPAGNWCAVGRPRSGSNNGVSRRKFDKRMRQPRENGAPGVPRALAAACPPTTRNRLGTRSQSRIRARGHAAKFFLLLFVTGLAAMTRCVPPAAAMRATAATVAAKPSSACAIVNVSG